MSLEEDLLAEGEPEKEFHPGIASRLPRKRVAAGALIRDPDGRILFVVPNYKPGLDIPGGVVNADESPLAACRREVREEIGADVAIGGLLLVDWVPAHGAWADGLMFIFNGGGSSGRFRNLARGWREIQRSRTSFFSILRMRSKGFGRPWFAG